MLLNRFTHKHLLSAIFAILVTFQGCMNFPVYAVDLYEQNTEQDPERFHNTSFLAQAGPSLDMLVHNSRFDDNYVTQTGVDVSKYQRDIDWELAANDGISFAIVRIGYRGYGNGALMSDPYCMTNLAGAAAAGLDTGVYFFSQALTVEEAIEEANYVLSELQGFSLTLPVYIDMEDVPDPTARTNITELTNVQRTEICQAFCSVIEAGGYDAGVYANSFYLSNKLDAEALAKDYSIWLAHYTTESYYTGDYQMWQYADEGSVSGIYSQAVDMNVRYSRKVGYVADALSIEIGQGVSPVLYGDSILSYRSSDPDIAIVDRNGVITGVGKGTVQITAISSNGSSDSIEITINKSETPTFNYADMIYSKLANPLSGDCNLDGHVNASDAANLLIFAAVAGADGTSDNTVSDTMFPAYDFNDDGIINASDAACILIASAEKGAG